MSHPPSPVRLSREEILAVYAHGSEAVIVLVEELVTRIEVLEILEARVQTLEDRLGKNSRNSSKPPSGDGFGKRTQSLRQRSERPSGGQRSHPGQTLEWREDVTEIVDHRVHECCGCGVPLATVPVSHVLGRQVQDLPVLALEVTEHRAEVKSCPQCGLENRGTFPREAPHRVQYGPRLKGLMVYLMEGQLLPAARTCELLHEVCGAAISSGTLFNTRAQCFEVLAPISHQIQ